MGRNLFLVGKNWEIDHLLTRLSIESIGFIRGLDALPNVSLPPERRPRARASAPVDPNDQGHVFVFSVSCWSEQTEWEMGCLSVSGYLPCFWFNKSLGCRTQ